jgi:hypothetical protein
VRRFNGEKRKPREELFQANCFIILHELKIIHNSNKKPFSVFSVFCKRPDASIKIPPRPINPRDKTYKSFI